MDNLINYKAQLISELSVQYKNLVNFLSQLPIGQRFKDYGFQNLDQGIMWMHKGIEVLQVDNTKESVVQEQKNPEPVVEEKPAENKTIY